ncbi:MAG: ATP-binding cassette domain-containing protein, partial [Clostridia bacterium]|nr:ATP-binding cassette domain-containing protein [Clostridia bacterium]
MLVNLDNVTYGYTDVPVVEHVSFSVNEGERIGLLGGNGEGKTTLIKLMLGYLTPDAGAVTKKNGIRVGYLEQSGGFEGNDTVEAAMRRIFREDEELIERLREVEKQMAAASEKELPALSARYESLNKRIAARDSYHFEVKIKTVLGGMGFLDRLDQNTATMSGGEKTRLKLCRLLLEEPDLLVLDEPTNHLDIKTLFWLEDYLSSYRGALFIVSHDRYFLDKLTSRTLELLAGTLVSYQGNYSKYKVLREERYKTLEREYEKQQEEIAKLQDYVDRNI